MKKTITYPTVGTCSQAIIVTLNEDRTIAQVSFAGGCHGNTQGVASLVRGMKVDEVIERCKGIQCRAGTSCPDQLACALEQMKAANKGA